MKDLWFLTLSGTNVGDEGMVHIASLPNLKSLSLSSTKVGDTGVDSLKEMAELSKLNLDQSNITDGSKSVLLGQGNFPKLRILSVNGTKMSPNVVMEVVAKCQERRTAANNLNTGGGNPPKVESNGPAQSVIDSDAP